MIRRGELMSEKAFDDPEVKYACCLAQSQSQAVTREKTNRCHDVSATKRTMSYIRRMTNEQSIKFGFRPVNCAKNFDFIEFLFGP